MKVTEGVGGGDSGVSQASQKCTQRRWSGRSMPSLSLSASVRWQVNVKHVPQLWKSPSSCKHVRECKIKTTPNAAKILSREMEHCHPWPPDSLDNFSALREQFTSWGEKSHCPLKTLVRKTINCFHRRWVKPLGWELTDEGSGRELSQGWGCWQIQHSALGH